MGWCGDTLRLFHVGFDLGVRIDKRATMKHLTLYLKGLCMGVADIIPGVSGGTLALILGIYVELVNTIKGLNLRWIPSLIEWIRTGFGREEGRDLWAGLKGMNLPFLLVLGGGILTAIAIGGMIVPTLLERYPEVMRALFFGLILASVPVPLKMVGINRPRTAGIVVLSALCGGVLGFSATAPQRMMEVGVEWTTVEARPGESFGEITRRVPSAWAGEQVFWASENEALRQAVAGEVEARELQSPEGSGQGNDKDGMKARSEAYADIEVPVGTVVQIPQPGLVFVFVVGMIAICAMILPGISGSYLLLILGAYFFVLNVLKGVILGMVALSPPPGALIYLLAFGLGALVGLLSFARLMSFLLRDFPAPTLGLLVGLMVGCLRGIWPFQAMIDGELQNVMPASVHATVVAVLIAALVGALVVTLLGRWSGRMSA